MSGVRAARSAPRRAAREGRALLAALTFLTRIPLGGARALDGEDVARAAPAFPLVGAGVGAAVGGAAAALSHPLSPLLAAAVALTLGALLTGALHLDGLADCADALAGGSPARALEIMRDHAVGAYGAVAIGLDLLVKGAALAALASRGGVLVLRDAVVAGALSRLAPVLLAAALPYARAGGGTGASLAAGSRSRALLAALVGVALALAVTGLDGLVLAACSAIVVLALGLALRGWIGGVTGDALGAASS